MPPSIDTCFLKDLKDYDRHLSVEWNHDIERWAIKRKDENGTIHHIFFVQHPDGSYRPLDRRTMEELYECDLWKHFKDGGEYHRFIQERNRAVKLKEETLRKEYLEWFNKDNRHEWRDAIENAQKGKL